MMAEKDQLSKSPPAPAFRGISGQLEPQMRAARPLRRARAASPAAWPVLRARPAFRHIKEQTVRTTFTLLTAALVVSVSVVSASRQQGQPAGAHTMNIDEAMKAYRSDLQTSRTDIIAKNVTLSSEQAAKFWPIFERYQKEQSALI